MTGPCCSRSTTTSGWTRRPQPRCPSRFGPPGGGAAAPPPPPGGERRGVAFPRPMQGRLHEASGGNPFYALELARARLTDGSSDGSALTLPASLERLVDARLDP